MASGGRSGFPVCRRWRRADGMIPAGVRMGSMGSTGPSEGTCAAAEHQRGWGRGRRWQVGGCRPPKGRAWRGGDWGGLCSGFGLGICQPGQHSSRGLRGDHPSRPDSVCTCQRSAAGGAGQTLALSASAWRALGWLRRSCELGLQGRQMALRGRGRGPSSRGPSPCSSGVLASSGLYCAIWRERLGPPGAQRLPTPAPKGQGPL